MRRDVLRCHVFGLRDRFGGWRKPALMLAIPAPLVTDREYVLTGMAAESSLLGTRPGTSAWRTGKSNAKKMP